MTSLSLTSPLERAMDWSSIFLASLRLPSEDLDMINNAYSDILIFSFLEIPSRTDLITSVGMRLNSKCCHLDTMVAGILWKSVVAMIK